MEGINLFDVWRNALVTMAAVAAPFLLSALAVGLATALIQAATRMQENVLSFVPKIIAVLLVMSLAGPWMLGRLTRYTTEAFEASVITARSINE